MKKLFFCLATAGLLASCGQNDKAKTGTPETPVASASSGDNLISFKAGDKLVKSEGWVVMRFVWDSKSTTQWLNITSSMHKDKRTINVNLAGTTAGTYVIDDSKPMMSNSHGAYFPDFSKPLESYSWASGEFNITSVDTVKGLLNGSFSGTVKNSEGKTITISDGVLNNVKMKTGVTNLTEGLQ